MPMHESPAFWFCLLAAAATGLALGAFFFASLWWTVRRSLSSSVSVAWQLGGLLVRLGITLLGFYVAGVGHWERLLACLAGFLVARLVAARLAHAWERAQAAAATVAAASAGRNEEEVHAPQS